MLVNMLVGVGVLDDNGFLVGNGVGGGLDGVGEAPILSVGLGVFVGVFV